MPMTKKQGKKSTMKAGIPSKDLKWNKDNVTDVDFPDAEITLEAMRNQNIAIRGCMRISMGLVYTREAWERKRKRVLSTPLP